LKAEKVRMPMSSAGSGIAAPEPGGSPGPGVSPVASPSAGFSLLELVLVVLVLGLALAISYPSLSRGSSALHLRSAGRDVLNVLRYARERSITEQSELHVIAEKEARRVVLTDELGEGGRPCTLPSDVRIERLLLGNEEIREGPLVIRFLPNGSSTPATIVLKSEAGGFLRIVTEPITGGARILQGEGVPGS
jgi:prepilin-type N-terminal cleavage/methylation domain-containing protein